MGRLEGSLTYCCLKLFLLLLSAGPAFSNPSPKDEDSMAVPPGGTSSLQEPLL